MPSFSPLTTSGQRALVAAAVDDLLGIDAAVSLLVADTIDAVSGAACRAAGLSDDEARQVLAQLWGQQ